MRRWEHLLSLGSNIDPERWVPRAVSLASGRFDVARVSSLYDVPAVGGAPGTPAFVNLAVRITTDLPPRALAEACRRIEDACDRVRRTDRFAPRTLDMDVVYSLDGDSAPLSHADLEAEAYVLVPCAEIWPEAALPGGDVTLAQRAAALFPGWSDAHRRAAPDLPAS